MSLPALRERRDLGALIQHLLRAETAAQPALQLSTAALQALLDYRWPGNIRQLYQCLRLAAALAEDDGEIGVQHLPDEVRARQGEQLAAAAAEGQVAEAGSTLQVAEARAIRAAVEAAGGNLSAAARNLGIARATLYRKLKGMEQG